jgi:hypothetical protein
MNDKEDLIKVSENEFEQVAREQLEKWVTNIKACLSFSSKDQSKSPKNRVKELIELVASRMEEFFPSSPFQDVILITSLSSLAFAIFGHDLETKQEAMESKPYNYCMDLIVTGAAPFLLFLEMMLLCEIGRKQKKVEKCQ